MNIDDITTMIIGAAPALRTNEINALTDSIFDYLDGQGSLGNIQAQCNVFIGRGHMAPEQMECLFIEIDNAMMRM